MSTMGAKWQLFAAAIASGVLALAAMWPAHAQMDEALLERLRAGGYVLIMRHARAPRAAPDAATARAGNRDRERQLDDAGLATAAAMGQALRALEIPVGVILTSPTFRAVETAQQLALGEARAVPQLGDGGTGMRPDTEGERSAWLRERAGQPPPAGTNALFITHVPNLVGAFGESLRDSRDGEALIVDPRGGAATIVARVAIEDWPAFAAERH